MELKKQPITESDYWEVIEGLGGFIWNTNHGLAHDHIEESAEREVSKEILEAGELSGRLLSEISEKFGIIRPVDYPKINHGETLPPAPEGKTYYWDWYKKMKEVHYLKDYEAIICSACPFSDGLKEMISLGGVVPCGIFSGMVYHLPAPFECVMLYSKDWSREELYSKILEKSDEQVLLGFKNKEKELKEKFQKEQ